MARKAREAKPPEPTAVTEETVRGELVTLDAGTLMESQQQAAVRAVALRLGYELPAESTDPDLIQRDIAANMRRSVEACLEVGRGLAVLRQACGHGNFMARLDVLGIEPRVAQKFMQSATKFSNASSTAHLTSAIGTQTKLFEMLVLDDEQIEELALTGETGELKLDDIATMSVKELRAALREARANDEAKDRLLADKNARLDALAARVIDPLDEKVAAFKSEISAGFDVLDDAVGKLYLIHGAILDEEVSWAKDEAAERLVLRGFAVLYGDRLNRLLQQFAELRDHYEATLSGWAADLDGREIALGAQAPVAD